MGVLGFPRPVWEVVMVCVCLERAVLQPPHTAYRAIEPELKCKRRAGALITITTIAHKARFEPEGQIIRKSR